MLGSDKDPKRRDFPLALTDTRGARCYVTLFEAPFEASALSDRENNTLQASSLRAVPPPPPGMPSLAGLTTVDLNLKIFTDTCTECMITARDSS